MQAAGRRLLSQFELRPLSLDENIAAFRLNIEGQTIVYRHGPARSSRFQWPGPQTDLGVRLTFQTLDGREINQSAEGPWAWLRILDKALVEATSVPDRFRVTFQKGGFQARFELRASSVDNPFKLAELKRFRCPEVIVMAVPVVPGLYGKLSGRQAILSRGACRRFCPDLGRLDPGGAVRQQGAIGSRVVGDIPDQPHLAVRHEPGKLRRQGLGWHFDAERR